MSDITVTNSNIVSENTSKEITMSAATTDTASTAQKFIINNSRADWKTIVLIKNASASDDLAYSFAKGEMQGGKVVSGTIPEGKTVAIQLENLKVAKNNGNIELTLTPAAAKRLLTDHGAAVGCIALV